MASMTLIPQNDRFCQYVVIPGQKVTDYIYYH